MLLFGGERGAQLRPSAAAVLCQIADQRPHGGNGDRIEDMAGFTARADQPGALELSNMVRERRSRYAERISQTACRHSLLPRRHETAKNIEPRIMREGGKNNDGGF